MDINIYCYIFKSVLKELSKKDDIWRKYAFKICGCKSKADDLVNDMYLKLADKQREISNGYVYLTLKSIFIDNIRKDHLNAISLEDLYNDIEDVSSEILSERYELIDILRKDVSFFHKEILLITHETSLRKAEEEIDVPVSVLRYHKKKALNKLKDKYGRAKG